MSSSPLVTVVIPVYNVEQYLRECLDSVVNQTMRDIQIICVNDGSPDNSQQILEEYAAQDSRVQITVKENGGLSSARNAAYPHIQGKYTLFVDSDDWIDLTLCEKTYAVAENENADMTLFFFHYVPNPDGRIFPLEQYHLQHQSLADVDKKTLLGHMNAWSKLWKTSFMIDNDITFPEGLCYEDNVAHWKALVLSPKLALVNERLYFHRNNPTSIMNDRQAYNNKDVVAIYECIKEMLLQKGLYKDEWKELFLLEKLNAMYYHYRQTVKKFKPHFLDLIKSSIGEDEALFLHKHKNSNFFRLLRYFYHSLDGNYVSRLKYLFYRSRDIVSRRIRKLMKKI